MTVDSELANSNLIKAIALNGQTDNPRQMILGQTAVKCSLTEGDASKTH